MDENTNRGVYELVGLLQGRLNGLFALQNGPDQGLFVHAEQLVTLDAIIDTLAELNKWANLETNRVEKNLFELMVAEEVPTFERQGTEFSADYKEFISDVADKRDDLFRAFRENGLGDIIKTKEAIHPATFGKTIRELRDEHDGELPAWLPEGSVRIYSEPKVARKKAKK